MLTEAEAVFHEAVSHPGPFARKTQQCIEDAFEALAWARRSLPNADDDLRTLDQSEAFLNRAKQILNTVEVDIDGLHSEVQKTRSTLDDITTVAFGRRIGALSSEIDSAKSRKRVSESSIKNLVQQMKETKAGGIGCLFAGIFFIFGVVGFPMLVLPWQQQLSTIHSTPLNLFAVSVFVGWIALGYQVGKKIARSQKNQASKEQVKQNERAIEESDRQLPALESRFDRLRKEAQQLTDWRSVKARQPSVS